MEQEIKLRKRKGFFMNTWGFMKPNPTTLLIKLTTYLHHGEVPSWGLSPLKHTSAWMGSWYNVLRGLRLFWIQWIFLFILIHIYFDNLRFVPYQQFYLVPMCNSTDWLHRIINFWVFYYIHMMCLGQPYLFLMLLPLLWSLNFSKQPVFTFIISPWDSTHVRRHWTAVSLHLTALDDL